MARSCTKPNHFIVDLFIKLADQFTDDQKTTVEGLLTENNLYLKANKKCFTNDQKVMANTTMVQVGQVSLAANVQTSAAKLTKLNTLRSRILKSLL